jgi:hypothetical protein
MSIADNRRSDDKDVTVEHIERVAKGKKALRVQMDKIFEATYRLKAIAESATYFVGPTQWDEILAEARRELDGLDLHLRRIAEKQRGPRRWES